MNTFLQLWEKDQNGKAPIKFALFAIDTMLRVNMYIRMRQWEQILMRYQLKSVLSKRLINNALKVSWFFVYINGILSYKDQILNWNVLICYFFHIFPLL